MLYHKKDINSLIKKYNMLNFDFKPQLSNIYLSIGFVTSVLKIDLFQNENKADMILGKGLPFQKNLIDSEYKSKRLAAIKTFQIVFVIYDQNQHLKPNFW